MNSSIRTDVIRRSKPVAIRNEPTIMTNLRRTVGLLVASDALSISVSMIVSVAVAGLLYAAHTKKWILSPIARRAGHRSTDSRTSPEN